MLAQLADIRLCALMSLRPYVPAPLCPCALMSALLCPCALMSAPYVLRNFVCALMSGFDHFFSFVLLLTVSDIMPPRRQRIQKFPGSFSLAGGRVMVSKCHTSQSSHYSLLFLSLPFFFS